VCEIDERTLSSCCRVSEDQTDATEEMAIFSYNVLNEAVCVRDSVSMAVSSRKFVFATAQTCDAFQLVGMLFLE
jgi:hypothetical protein